MQTGWGLKIHEFLPLRRARSKTNRSSRSRAFLLMLFVFVQGLRFPKMADYGPLVVIGISLVGALNLVTQQYPELTVIQAIYLYCVLSAVVLVTLLIISTYRLLGDRAVSSLVS